MSVQRYTFGYVDLEASDERELQMIPARFGEAVKYADYEALERRLVEADRLLRLYRHPKNLSDTHIGCYEGPGDARGELGCGWDDARCKTCKATDAHLGGER
jgi:hypothetical protein